MTTTAPQSAAASRGFLAGVDVNELRRRITQAPYDKAWALLQSRTREQIEHQRKTKFATYTGGIGWHSITPVALEAALMVHLTDDADALLYVEECIQATDAYARAARAKKPNGQLVNIHSHAQIAMAADMLRDRLSPASIQTLKAFMRELAIPYHSGIAAYAKYNAGNNIAWCQSVHAAACALLWGEESGYADWRTVVDHGIAHSRGYLKYGCDAAGFSYEGTGYGHGVFSHLFPFVQLLKQSGYTDLYAQEPRLRALFDSSLQSLFPSREFLTNDNDVGLCGAASIFYLLLAYRQWRDPVHLGFWYEYQGPDSAMRPYGDFGPWMARTCGYTSAPSLDLNSSLFFTVLFWDAAAPYTPLEQSERPTVSYSPGTERVDLRTSWSRNAVYVNLLGGGRSHMCQTHRHADTGHFSLFAYGDYLAIDTGRYNSNEDQHNVVLVNGKNHLHVQGWHMDNNKGWFTNFQSAGDLTHIQADASHMKGCFWADRHFLFVKYGPDQAYLILLDSINVNNDKNNFLWQLQANHDCKIEVQGAQKAAIVGPRARIDMTFAVPGPEDFPTCPHEMVLRQDMKEWQWPYGKGQVIDGILKMGVLQSSVRRPRFLADVTGLNGVILAALCPRRHGEAPLDVRHVQKKGVLQMDLDAGEYRDTVLAAPDRGFIDTDAVSGMTSLAWIRRDATGRLLRAWTVDGAPLQFKK